MILPGMKQKPLAFKIERLYAASARIFPDLLETGAIRFEVGWAHYPEDAVTAKLILAIAEGRREHQTGSLTENLLALHAYHRREIAEATGVSEDRAEQTAAAMADFENAELHPAVVQRISGAPTQDHRSK